MFGNGRRCRKKNQDGPPRGACSSNKLCKPSRDDIVYSLPAAANSNPQSQSTQYAMPTADWTFQRLTTTSPINFESPTRPPRSPPPLQASMSSLNLSSTPLPSYSSTVLPPYASREQSLHSPSVPSTPRHTGRNDSGFSPLHNQAPQDRSIGCMNQGAALCDRISERINTLLTAMDGETYSGGIEDLSSRPPQQIDNPRELQHSPDNTQNPFAKVRLYSNSRLPPHLPPLKLYIPTYPLLCLAAQHSLRVYHPTPTPNPQSIPSHPTPQTISIPASILCGTKAMTLTTAALDTTRTIVLAIRGSQSFMDWAVNFRPAPTPPTSFLDDPGNLCHAGFLAVAKHMLRPIAKSLRALLEDRPERCAASLCFTGHSAGGAVAALLFCHCVSQDALVESELKTVAAAFRRVHCVTFGAPPVSLLPLQKPPAARADRRLAKSLFFAFVNEGDPVARADVAFVKSLVNLYACPAPLADLDTPAVGPIWPVPPGTLSCAGRMVLLRSVPSPSSSSSSSLSQQKQKAKKAGALRTAKSGFNLKGKGVGDVVVSAGGDGGTVTASLIADDMLRGVVFGELGMHVMRVYCERVERLAVGAVTGGGTGW